MTSRNTVLEVRRVLPGDAYLGGETDGSWGWGLQKAGAPGYLIQLADSVAFVSDGQLDAAREARTTEAAAQPVAVPPVAPEPARSDERSAEAFDLLPPEDWSEPYIMEDDGR